MKRLSFLLLFVAACTAGSFLIGYAAASSEVCEDAGECALEETVRGLEYGAYGLAASVVLAGAYVVLSRRRRGEPPGTRD